jgi:hypothetical protein
MESMDHVHERIEALAQQIKVMGAHTRTVERRWRGWRGIACAGLLVSLMSLARPSQAADLACAAGKVACLIDAINTANANGEANTITLEAGTYTLTAVDNTTDGPNGLPSVTGSVTIKGAGAEATRLARDASAPVFRLGHVAATGSLTLDGLTIRGFGSLSFPLDGGGLRNQQGTLTLTNVTLTTTRAFIGGGIFNQEGTVILAQTTLADNENDGGGGLHNEGGQVILVNTTLARNRSLHGGGGIFNAGGTVTLMHSTLRGNVSLGGGGLFNARQSTAFIIDSTIADNATGSIDPGGGIVNLGTLTILNSTIARNTITGSVSGAGIASFIPAVSHILSSTIADNQGSGLSGSGFVLLNTILARNTGDCFGIVTSLGTNLIDDPTGCPITLQPTDLTGDPGLGAFTDNGTPGNGHIPLRRGSPAIDAGNDAACPSTDQLGRRRRGPCDIGAIRFLDKDDRRDAEDPAAAAQVSQ